MQSVPTTRSSITCSPLRHKPRRSSSRPMRREDRLVMAGGFPDEGADASANVLYRLFLLSSIPEANSAMHAKLAGSGAGLKVM